MAAGSKKVSVVRQGPGFIPSGSPGPPGGGPRHPERPQPPGGRPEVYTPPPLGREPPSTNPFSSRPPPPSSTERPTTSSLVSQFSTIKIYPSPPSSTSTSMMAPTLTQSTASAASSSSTSSPSAVSARLSNDRVLTITLASVLSVAGVLIFVASVLLYRRYSQRRPPFFRRGITPIDDDEIESWKISREIRDEEKSVGGFEREVEHEVSGAASAPSTYGHVRATASTSSLKKIPSAVIVYQNPSGAPRQSEELSPRSFHSSARISRYGAHVGGGRVSMDSEFPQTPVQARAPNAREGLTDESIPGDEPYLPQPKRQPSRISKLQSPSSPTYRSMHARARSSKSSFRSFGDRYSHEQGSPYVEGHASSEQDLSYGWTRASSDLPRGGAWPAQSLQHQLRHSKSSTGYHGHVRGHNRVYSNSEDPPRLSFSDDYLSSPRPLLREDIGRAIG